MAGKFTSADIPNTRAIRDAIFDIALNAKDANNAPLGYSGGAKGRMPFANEILGVGGYPFLVVMNPTLAGSERQGGISAGITRMPSGYYPAFDFDVYAIYPPVTAQTDQTVLDAPEDAKNALISAFVVNYSLEQTCDSADITDAAITTLKFVTSEEFQAAKLTLRVLTQQNLDNTPA